VILGGYSRNEGWAYSEIELWEHTHTLKAYAYRGDISSETP